MSWLKIDSNMWRFKPVKMLNKSWCIFLNSGGDVFMAQTRFSCTSVASKRWGGRVKWQWRSAPDETQTMCKYCKKTFTFTNRTTDMMHINHQCSEKLLSQMSIRKKTIRKVNLVDQMILQLRLLQRVLRRSHGASVFS